MADGLMAGNIPCLLEWQETGFVYWSGRHFLSAVLPLGHKFDQSLGGISLPTCPTVLGILCPRSSPRTCISSHFPCDDDDAGPGTTL